MDNAPLLDHIEREPDREIHLNKPEANEEQDFCGNDVSTTKYSLLSFVPKNLWEQFQRVANLYFLLISLVQIFSNASPTGKYNTFLTLVVVLMVSGGKEAYEDWKRHKADVAHNQRSIQVLRRTTWLDCEWSDVVVGDIIKVFEKNEIPADTVILSSSLGDGKCYIETANLDGEANLKIRQANSNTMALQDDAAKLGAIAGRVQCSPPSMSMLSFEGRWLLDGQTESLGLENLAMRGCRLRNTKWITGVVVYSGHESKILLNSTPTRFKQSSLEKVANTLIIVVFLFELVLCIFAALSAGIWHSSYVGTGEHTAWYLENEQSPSGFAAEAFLSFFILVSNLIPISLYVTMEVMKICLSWFIEQDIDMYSALGDETATARTTNLSEELGQVGYIFSDKTGTLTSNEMQFRKCSIAGAVFTDDAVPYGTGLTEADEEGTTKQPFECALLSEALANNADGNEALFLRILALCHTVIPEPDPDNADKLVYQGSSPDDVALVEAAAAVGVVFKEANSEGMTIQLGEETVFYNY